MKTTRALVVMLAIAALTGCAIPTPTPTVTSTPISTPTVTVTPTPTEPTLQLPSSPGGPIPDGAVSRFGIGAIRAAALSPDTNYIAVGTTTAMYLYDTATFKQIWRAPVKSPVVDIVWSPDGKWIASWLPRDSNVYVWDAASGNEAASIDTGIPYLGYEFNIAWSPDSSYLAVPQASDSPGNRVGLWDSVTWNRLRDIRFDSFEQYEFRSPFSVIALSPDGKMIAGVMDDGPSGDDQTLLVLADVDTGAVTSVLSGPPPNQCASFQGLAFSPDSASIATFAGAQGGGDVVCSDNRVLIWDLDTRALFTLEHGSDIAQNVETAAWSPSGDALLIGADKFQGGGVISLWERSSRTQAVLTQPTLPVNSVAWSPDGQLFAAGLGEFGTSGLDVWDKAGQVRLEAAPEIDSAIQRVQWLSDSRSVLAVTYLSMTLWNVDNGSPIRSLVATVAPTSEMISVGWSPDGDVVVTDQLNRDSTDTFVEWDVASGKALRVGEDATPYETWWPHREPESVGETLIPLSSPIDEVTSVVLSPDGKLRAVASDIYGRKPAADVTIWDTSTGHLVIRLSGFPYSILTLDWSHDGTMLVAGGGIPYGHGSFFVEGWLENKIVIWDTSDWSVLQTFVGHTGQTRAVAFSPDDSQLASASADDTVIIWQVK